MTANQILREKTIPQMTLQEIGIVMDRAKEAYFENLCVSKNSIDKHKRAMGRWALTILKDPETDFALRIMIKEKYKHVMNYYINNKELPQPAEKDQKIDILISNLECELFFRGIDIS